MNADVILLSGLLLGFAGSAHCACLCGGIASSLMLATAPESRRSSSFLMIQFGRILRYAVAGGAVGSMIEAFGQLLRFSGGQEALRLIAAAALIWSGLSIVGILPAIWRLDGGIMAVIGRAPAAISRPFNASAPLFVGICWGLAPCAMVYNALMTAMLTGSMAGGALFMTGFGLATIPAVSAVAAGAAVLTRPQSSRWRGPALRRTAGLLLSAIGVLSVTLPAASLASLCFG
ncbi:sulfite exporter TauE/SafE family protein [Rhizobium sp. CNPSo 4039]|uniref:sulfite exporter TauE/SafE family protein n=1 Tax=Rhizobium sp. CNPSo 4039 TaxID=3021409 RepID=UPI00254EB770|nr:sulfite exporter TauE/SafE family protein [Rhizobium sp. CNPSo 4039]MDK4717605.1 sulfite exporter TauE/SafE family protein [Rhizobium sp. CNPSo 4039]